MDNVKASGMDAAANQPNVKSPVGVSAPRRPRRTSERHARQLMRRAWWVVVGAIVPVGIWMSVAPLSMAVVAPGLVKVDLNRRPVQHLEGGIVREVLVRDGETVKAGDPVLMIGDVGVEADRNRLLYRANVERASVVRLDAARSSSPRSCSPRRQATSGCSRRSPRRRRCSRPDAIPLKAKRR
jgi:multidrug efflux pump subunit AcrA (membrane-fusion protein)